MTRNNFSAKLVAVAGLMAPLVVSQMPRECFHVMNLHGYYMDEEEGDTLYETDLPYLMTYMKPTMRFQSLKASQLDDDKISLQLSVGVDGDETTLQTLSLFGSDEAITTETRPIDLGTDFDGFTLLVNDQYGICNVIVEREGNGELPLYNLCTQDDEDVDMFTYYLPQETPLVGLHGEQTEDGIMTLGLILLDTLDPMCQKPAEKAQNLGIGIVSKLLIDKRVTDEISLQERERAKILDSILLTDKLHESRYWETDQIGQKIKELTESKPIVLHKDATVNENLLEVVDILHDNFESGEKITMEELFRIYKHLSQHFQEKASSQEDNNDTILDNELPITISELQKVFNYLAKKTGTEGSPFEQMEGQDAARVADFEHVIDLLAIYYSQVPDPKLVNDFSDSANELIAAMFDKMAEFYAIKDDMDLKDSIDLFFIFAELIDVYRKPEDVYEGQEKNDDVEENNGFDDQDEDSEKFGDEDDEDNFDELDRFFEPLNDLLSIIEQMDMNMAQLTPFMLVDMFHDLATFNDNFSYLYDGKVAELTLGDLKKIYKYLAQEDRTFGSPYEQRGDDEEAVLSDITPVLAKLAQHYTTYEYEVMDVDGNEQFVKDWNKAEEFRNQLASLFGLMDNFFKQDKIDYGEKVEIWFIFDSLEQIFQSQFETDPENVDGEDSPMMPESEQLIVELSKYLIEQKTLIEEGGGWGQDLEIIFYTLQQHYDQAQIEAGEAGEAYENFELGDIKIGELKGIYGHLAYRDGSRGSPYDELEDDQTATLLDFRHLIDKLVVHYSRVIDLDDFEPSGESFDLKPDDAQSLSTLFDHVSMFYMMKDLAEGEAADLFFVYDQLEEIYFIQSQAEEVEPEPSDDPKKSQEILTKLVDYLEILSTDLDGITIDDLREVFLLLGDHYDLASQAQAVNMDAILPVMGYDLWQVYDELDESFEASDQIDNGDDFNARLADMTALYDVLAIRYSQLPQSNKNESQIVNSAAAEGLANIFTKLAQMYNDMDAQTWQKTTADLNFVYQTLSEMYVEFASEAADAESKIDQQYEEDDEDPYIEQLLEILQQQDMRDNEYTVADMREVFDQLSQHYISAAFELGSDQPAKIDMLTLKDIKVVYGNILKLDGTEGLGNIFEHRSDRDIATVRSIQALIELLTKHYSHLVEQAKSGASGDEMSASDQGTLADIFGLMSQYYLFDPDDLLSEQRQLDLMFIYERLETIFREFSIAAASKDSDSGESMDNKVVDEEEIEKVIEGHLDEVLTSEEFEENLAEFEDKFNQWTDFLSNEIEEGEEFMQDAMNEVKEEQEAEAAKAQAKAKADIEAKQKKAEERKRHRAEKEKNHDRTFTSESGDHNERRGDGGEDEETMKEMMSKMVATLAMFAFTFLALVSILAICVCRAMRKRSQRRRRGYALNDTSVEMTMD